MANFCKPSEVRDAWVFIFKAGHRSNDTTGPSRTPHDELCKVVLRNPKGMIMLSGRH